MRAQLPGHYDSRNDAVLPQGSDLSKKPSNILDCKGEDYPTRDKT